MAAVLTKNILKSLFWQLCWRPLLKEGVCASLAVAEPAVSPTVSPSKRDSLLCDGDTVDAVLGSVFD